MSEERKPANIYTLDYDLGNGRRMQITGNFYDGQTGAEKHAALTEIVEVVERQRARLAIEMLELRERQQAKQLEDMIDQMTVITEKIGALKGRDKEPNVRSQLDAMSKAKEQLLKSMEEGVHEMAVMRRFVETGAREAM